MYDWKWHETGAINSTCHAYHHLFLEKRIESMHSMNRIGIEDPPNELLESCMNAMMTENNPSLPQNSPCDLSKSNLVHSNHSFSISELTNTLHSAMSPTMHLSSNSSMDLSVMPGVKLPGLAYGQLKPPSLMLSFHLKRKIIPEMRSEAMKKLMLKVKKAKAKCELVNFMDENRKKRKKDVSWPFNIFETRKSGTNSLYRPKIYSSSACTNCKHAHLACGSVRPCLRCIRTNKADTCVDYSSKKRGRPRHSTTRALDESGSGNASESESRASNDEPSAIDDLLSMEKELKANKEISRPRTPLKTAKQQLPKQIHRQALRPLQNPLQNTFPNTQLPILSHMTHVPQLSTMQNLSGFPFPILPLPQNDISMHQNTPLFRNLQNPIHDNLFPNQHISPFPSLYTNPTLHQQTHSPFGTPSFPMPFMSNFAADMIPFLPSHNPILMPNPLQSNVFPPSTLNPGAHDNMNPFSKQISSL